MTAVLVLWIAAALLVLCFGAVLIIGAPYMPTLKKTCAKALELLDLKPGQTLIDLGCGDGVMLKLAAEAGLNAVGYELNPLLVIIAKARTLRYGRRVRVVWGNFWQADVSGADGVYVFLLERFMARLDRKIKAEGRAGVRLVSHAFKIPGRKTAASAGALFLYKY